MKKCVLIAAVLIAGAAHQPAHALTNADVLGMSSDESYAYISATVEMAAFLTHKDGNAQRSKCIMDWYFRTDNGPANVRQAFERFSDRTPQAVVYALINRECGDPPAGQ